MGFNKYSKKLDDKIQLFNFEPRFMLQAQERQQEQISVISVNHSNGTRYLYAKKMICDNLTSWFVLGILILSPENRQFSVGSKDSEQGTKI